MGPNPWVRALDYVTESCWLLALVAVPIFFDTMTVRIFEPDKIVLFRNIVLVMVLATLLRAILTAPAAMAGATTAGPWRRSRSAREHPLSRPQGEGRSQHGPSRRGRPGWRAPMWPAP